MSDGSLRVPITGRFLVAGQIPRITAKTRRLEEESQRTGISEHVLDGGTEATAEDFHAMEFGAQFRFIETLGG